MRVKFFHPMPGGKKLTINLGMALALSDFNAIHTPYAYTQGGKNLSLL
jgi:hypothetical protein